MKIKDSKVLVYGLGKSGIGAAGLLLKHGADVYLFDANKDLNIEKIKSETDESVKVFVGELPIEIISQLDFVVVSPGVPLDSPDILKIYEHDVNIYGEIELAYSCSKGDILAITGTNGKTTTTTLLGEIIKEYNENTFVVGNIGNPYTSVADETTSNSSIVAEISSFQLETIKEFRPMVSAILNITPDHLDRHHTMEAYSKAKFKITENQIKDDFCILNYDDEIIKLKAADVKAKIVYFSSSKELISGVFIKDSRIILKYAGEYTEVCNLDELQILGLHNYENVMAAVAMAYVYGVPVELIAKVVKEFKGVEHRIEYVTEKDGVQYYNDSKGTNPDAAMKAVGAMKRPTVLIAGGYDKGSSYKEWIQGFSDVVKTLVLVGETKYHIKSDALSVGFPNDIIMAETFEEAVHKASEYAEKATVSCCLRHVKVGICDQITKQEEIYSRKL
ncbi:MAG: UDP-N-acetylmuramoyl-L-alanine--D-glutamate ligase [Suipraeoptans sp.]